MRYIKGLSFYIIAFLIIIFAFQYTKSLDNNADKYTHSQFKREIINTVNNKKGTKKVDQVFINQSQNVPTGTVVVTYKNSKNKELTANELNVSDVKEIEKELKEWNFDNYSVRPVEEPSMLETLLP